MVEAPPRTRLTRVSSISVARTQPAPALVETGGDRGGLSRATAASAAPVVAATAAAAHGAPAISAAPVPDRSPIRPAPSRTAVLAAFQAASRPVPAAAVARPAPAVAPPPVAPAPPPMLMVAPMSRASVSRVETAVASAPNGNRSPAEPAPAMPDFDALADYVLERLRSELRDGRERLGLLLDDSR